MRRPDTIALSHMSESFAAPPRIRRIAARRMYRAPSGKPVVVTLGVPEPVPGSDWGCPLQITGRNTIWRRPKYVFGIDGLQALHLAMKCLRRYWLCSWFDGALCGPGDHHRFTSSPGESRLS